MRPIKMRLTAFGPFADAQTVDFRNALGSRLFGIYGPTGAGKTSILDGICFALFGESSGQERQGDDLRSHHATPEVETEVELVFEVGSKRYHVIRRPRQTVRGKRGDALVERQHTAALFDATALEVDDISLENPGVVMEERKVEVVAERIRAILNYSAAQFRQVVLLPQGQFRQLLTASSDQRSAVLRGLFDVALYERFVEKLKADAASLRDEVETGRAAIQGHLQVHEAADVEALGHMIDAAKAAVTAQDATCFRLRWERDAARLALQHGQQTEGKFAEHDSSIAELEATFANVGKVAAFQARKAAAKRAVEIAAADSRAEEAEGDLNAGLEVLAKAEADAAALETANTTAWTALQASMARQPERDTAIALVTQVQGLQARVARAEPLRAVARNSVAAALTSKRAFDQVAFDHTAAEQKATAVAARHEALQGRLRLISEVETQRQSLAQDHERAVAYERSAAAVDRLAGARTHVLDGLDQLRTVLTTAREDEAVAALALAAAQAFHLAHGLEEGVPCPVCGSPDHPRPANEGGDSAGLDSVWRAARSARESADAQERAASEAAARAEGEWSQAVALLAHQMLPMREAEAISKDLDDADERLSELRQNSDLEGSLAATSEAQEALAATLAAVTAAREVHVMAERAASSDAAALEASLADVVPELRDAAAIERRLSAVTEDRDRLTAAHQAVVEAERRAGEALQTARSALGHFQARRQDLARARETHLASFTTAKLAAGLDDAAYALAKADLPNLDTLTADIAAQASAEVSATDRRNRAALAIQGQVRPDLEAAGVALNAADGALAEADSALTTTKVRLERLQITHVLVLRLAGDLAAAAERYRVLGELAQLTDGRNAHRLRLRDYAIAATFDLVLEAANQRFARMSRGRFSLLRKHEGGDGRARAGLDIEVYDAHTDQKRDAHTLSGGEGFLASLSLALGLSDVVQAEAGGVKLDAIFIDEGFGHLDDETLDVALETLRDLVGQDRAVGVISHVEAVKDQIPVGFDVIRQPQGSVVSQRLGA